MDEVDDADDDNLMNPTGAIPGLVNLGDLHYSNKRKVLLELDVSPPGSTETPFNAAEWTLTLQRNGAQAQYAGRIQLRSTRDRTALGTEAIAVASAFAIQRSADLDLQVARHLAQGDRENARNSKEQQISLLTANLKAAQDASATNDAEVLQLVLERAQRVAVQLQDLGDDGDSDFVRRHCVHEVGLCRAMSEAGWRSGYDSDGDDIANLDDVNFTPPNSPPGSPLPRSRSPSSSTSSDSPRASRPARLSRSRSPSSSTRSTEARRNSSKPRRGKGLFRNFFKATVRHLCARSSRTSRVLR